jgi:hypothetical protein
VCIRPPRILAFFVFLVAGTIVHGGAASAAESPKRVRFDYQRDGGTVCPDAAALQVGVAARLGYDPFDDNAADRLRVTIRPTAHGLEARIEMDDRDGVPKAERRLLSRQHDCKELASSVELAISIAIDPSGSGAQASASRVSPSSAPPPPLGQAPTAEQLGASSSPPWRLDADLSAMLVAGFRSAPSTSLGLSVGAALKGEYLSLGIEARADWPTSQSLRVGSMGTSLYTASLVPCLRGRYVGFCALATAGLLHGAGEGLVEAKQANFFYAAVGARIALGYPVARHWSLALYGDAVSPLTESSLAVDGSTVWSSPTLAFALSLGVTANIP